MKNLRKKSSAALAALVLAAGLGVVAPGSASAAYCGITWGSLAKSAPVQTTGPITNVRAGQHPCFDRLVIDLRGERAGYHVRYVPAATQPGSGHAVPLRGGADLQIDVKSPAYDASGRATYSPGNRGEIVNTTGYTTFRQAALLGSFEGQTTFGLGVRARLPYRVFALDTPGAGSRLVIDVAHRW
jgi:hypothetical protein